MRNTHNTITRVTCRYMGTRWGYLHVVKKGERSDEKFIHIYPLCMVSGQPRIIMIPPKVNYRRIGGLNLAVIATDRVDYILFRKKPRVVFTYYKRNRDGGALHIEWGEPPTITLEKQVIVKAKETATDVKIKMISFHSDYRQKILKEKANYDFKRKTDEEGDPWIQIEIDKIPAGEEIKIVHQITIQTKPHTYNGEWNPIPNGEYLAETKYHQVKHPKIQETTRKLLGETPRETAYNILKYIYTNIRYKLTLERQGALKTLEYGFGKCADFADLYVAMLRASGIPARVVSGLVIKDIDDIELHAWVEINVMKNVWIQSDPTWGAFGGIGAIWVSEAKTKEEKPRVSLNYQNGDIDVDIRETIVATRNMD